MLSLTGLLSRVLAGGIAKSLTSGQEVHPVGWAAGRAANAAAKLLQAAAPDNGIIDLLVDLTYADVVALPPQIPGAQSNLRECTPASVSRPGTSAQKSFDGQHVVQRQST